MSLLRQGKALALSIYLGESDQWHGMPLYVAIVQFLRDQGCAGATVTRAITGYGAGMRLHESGQFRLSSDASLIIQVIDQPERLHRLIPHVQEMLSGGLMILHEVEVLKYTHARRRGLPAKLKVRQVMETMVTTASPDTPVFAVIDALLSAPFRVLPVVDEQRRLQGIISTGDLITAGVLPVRRGLVRAARELDEQTAEAVEAPLVQARQSSRTAQDVMNRQVRIVHPDDPVREAARVMLESGVRRLPVIERDGTLAGMLTRADLLQLIISSPLMSPHAASATQPLPRTGMLPSSTLAQQRSITEYVNPDVATVDIGTSLDEVIDALLLSPIGRVIVVDEQRRVKGVISDIDMLERLQAEQRPSLLSLFTNRARDKSGRPASGALRARFGQGQVAADVMNSQVVMVSENTSVQEAVEKMIATKRKVLPVVDTAGRLTGIVGRSDLLRVLLGEPGDNK
ncbi:MAG: DUF190 domain-containing protein [Ktedonobacteraceae bacterium]|nr:DUF190 domain-containing protein [Ktedonobacteraceae bacterium]